MCASGSSVHLFMCCQLLCHVGEDLATSPCHVQLQVSARLTICDLVSSSHVIKGPARYHLLGSPTSTCKILARELVSTVRACTVQSCSEVSSLQLGPFYFLFYETNKFIWSNERQIALPILKRFFKQPSFSTIDSLTRSSASIMNSFSILSLSMYS